ncbi:MAG: hypothetical protein Unbinned5179contig1000_23 [Prokaryotic dsDNA virus sp.]|nr:MAG: hypothetical protein Unbinned5179contig1000_23 [Prokaryotic dsDNA virus sp.]|tara:strand:+ start:334 stop:531 length:198 start_codon:yes stop_codon:yes gene_type:complete
MIIPKMLINTVANQMVKHFKLDKIMSYVFDDNELDNKVKEMDKRLNLLEKMAHPPKNCKCKDKNA